MVQEQILARGLTHSAVLAALERVPRQAFVPPEYRPQACDDTPLPIGLGQTISQPYIVAFMSATLDPRPGQRILEIGTGSGYQAAVLAELGAEVHSVELLEPLARRAQADLARLGYGRVQVHLGDGHLGWPPAAPYDGILVTCATEAVPPALVAQLKPGGRLVVPVGPQAGVQELYLLRKTTQGLETQAILPVRFVPIAKER